MPGAGTLRRGAEAALLPGRYLRLALLALSAPLLLLIVYPVREAQDNDLVFGLTLAFALLSLVPLVVAWRQRGLDLFEPVCFVTGLTFIAYCFPVILDAYTASLTELGEPRYLAVALGVATGGLLFFLIGYFSCRHLSRAIVRRLPPLPAALHDTRVTLAILLLCGVGWLARLYKIYAYGLFFNDVIGLQEEASLFSGVVSQLAALVRVGIALLCAVAFYGGREKVRRTGREALLLALVAAEVVYFALQGVKGGIILTLLIPLVAYHYLRRLSRLQLLAGVLLILLTFPVVNRYRTLASISGNPLEATVGIRQSFTLFYEGMADVLDPQESFSEFAGAAVQMVGGRLSHLNILATVIKQMPEAVEFQYGKTFLVVVNSFVPRFLWPGRPVGMFTNDLARQFGFNPFDFVTVTNFSVVEELYINFHVFGVIAGMLVLGIVLRSAYDYLMVAERLTPLRVFLYTFVIQLPFGFIDLPLSSTLMALPRELVILASVVFFIVQKSRRTRTVRVR